MILYILIYLCCFSFNSFVVLKGGGCSSLKYNSGRFQTYQQVRQSYKVYVSVYLSVVSSQSYYTVDVSVEVFKEQLCFFNPSQDSFWQPVTLLYVNYVSLLQ